MHQDDVYLDNHLETLCAAVSKQSTNVVTVSTDMGSIDENGIQYSSPPRAAWLLPDDSLETNFLANLRLQAVPWPSTAIRTESLFAVASAWHSSSFQDTEMMLHLAMIGKSVYLPVQTMLYRENPDSGSHELNRMEREVGAGLAMLRVFASDRFRDFLSHVPEIDRTSFARSVVSGVRARLGSNDICQYVQLHAAEVMQFNWGYKVLELNELVAHAYYQMGSQRTFEFLRSLNDSTTSDDRLSQLTRLYAFEPKFPVANKMEAAKGSRLILIGVKLVSVLPLRLKRFFFKKVISLIAKDVPEHPWNYKWR